MRRVAGAADTLQPDDRRIAFFAIVLIAFATRAAAFGNPVSHVDDQFYLLVGNDWWRGQLPYLDIWDRKGPGLFALYALLAKLGGGSSLFVQVVATLFAAATAWLIRAIALSFSGPRGALLAGLSYLLIIPLLGGQTGQSPVFYNLAMAGAVLLLIRSVDADLSTIRRRALWSMLLCGLAMSIKQVAFVEGAFFGLAFLFLMRRAGLARGALAANAAVMVIIALAPTALGILSFSLAGPDALATVVYANFVSIFAKASFGTGANVRAFGIFFVYAAPLMLFAALGHRALRREQPDRLERKLLLGWLCAAILGWLIVPNFFDHYALPLMMPLCVLAAPLFQRAGGHLYFGALALYCLAQGFSADFAQTREARVWFARLTQTTQEARRGGCLFLADGPTALYQAVPACRLTRYLFPEHLLSQAEVNAVGTDTLAELRRVLVQKPAVVVTQQTERPRHSAVADTLLTGTLHRHYRPVLTIPRDAPLTLATVQVWQRRDLAPPEQR